ncbi:hypothetical protein [Brevundimonas sp.]|uniref:hypothetical protein n=1 Tax=Brevundimonas sp. TaxID=1871086 RepID=UPI003D146AC7
MSLRLVALTGIVALSLSACGEPAPADKTAGEAAATSATAPAEAANADFDLASVPLSTADLAPSPYFAAPAGYRAEESGDIRATQFPIWLGDRFQIVEGDVHWTRIGAEDGKTLSRTEVERAVETAVLAAGGVKVGSGQVPESAASALPETMRQELLSALGDNTNSPTTDYVIRRADKTIWVHSVVSIEVAHLTVVDAPPLAPAAPGPASN